MGLQTLLLWCQAQDYTVPFTMTNLWSFIIRMFVLTACLSMIGAFTLVCISVALLSFRDASGPNADAPLDFSVSPIPAGYFALGVFGFGGFTIILFLGLFWLASAFELISWKKRGVRTDKPLNELDV
jgi:hypothetical protein